MVFKGKNNPCGDALIVNRKISIWVKSLLKDRSKPNVTNKSGVDSTSSSNQVKASTILG